MGSGIWWCCWQISGANIRCFCKGRLWSSPNWLLCFMFCNICAAKELLYSRIIRLMAWEGSRDITLGGQSEAKTSKRPLDPGNLLPTLHLASPRQMITLEEHLSQTSGCCALSCYVLNMVENDIVNILDFWITKTYQFHGSLVVKTWAKRHYRHSRSGAWGVPD